MCTEIVKDGGGNRFVMVEEVGLELAWWGGEGEEQTTKRVFR